MTIYLTQTVLHTAHRGPKFQQVPNNATHRTVWRGADVDDLGCNAGMLPASQKQMSSPNTCGLASPCWQYPPSQAPPFRLMGTDCIVVGSKTSLSIPTTQKQQDPDKDRHHAPSAPSA